MIKFLDLLKEEKKDLTFKKRLKMYLKYYKNLSPQDFKVKINKNKIEIELPEKSNQKPFD